MPAKLGGLWTTVHVLSNLSIDWLRRTEIGDRETGQHWHFHAFTGQQRGCVLGFWHALCSRKRSLLFF